MKLQEFKQTEIGRIPKEWEVVRLGDVITYIKGKKPAKILEEYKENCLPYLSTEYLRKNKTTTYVPISGDVVSVNDEDLILLWDGSNAGEIFLGKRGVLSSTMVKFELRENKYIPNFLFYLLKIKENCLKGQTKGTGIPHVDGNVLNALHLPLPPLPEQKKIAEILSTVDEAIQKVDEAITKTERLKKGLMQELLTGRRRVVDSRQHMAYSRQQIVDSIQHTVEREKTDTPQSTVYCLQSTEYKETEIGRIPKEWEVVKIGDIALDFLGGGTPSTSNQSYWDGDIAWMTSAHINDRNVTTGQRYITKEGLRNSAANLVPKDNLLIATRVGIGKVAVNKVDIAISQDLTGVIIDKTKAMSDFLYWNISTQERKLKSLAQGSTIKGILREELGKLKIPLPPLPEQKKIAEILSTVDRKIELLRERKKRFERIKKGLMNDLLTGRKRVKTAYSSR